MSLILTFPVKSTFAQRPMEISTTPAPHRMSLDSDVLDEGDKPVLVVEQVTIGTRPLMLPESEVSLPLLRGLLQKTSLPSLEKGERVTIRVKNTSSHDATFSGAVIGVPVWFSASRARSWLIDTTIRMLVEMNRLT